MPLCWGQNILEQGFSQRCRKILLFIDMWDFSTCCIRRDTVSDFHEFCAFFSQFLRQIYCYGHYNFAIEKWAEKVRKIFQNRAHNSRITHTEFSLFQRIIPASLTVKVMTYGCCCCCCCCCRVSHSAFFIVLSPYVYVCCFKIA